MTDPVHTQLPPHDQTQPNPDAPKPIGGKMPANNHGNNHGGGGLNWGGLVPRQLKGNGCLPLLAFGLLLLAAVLCCRSGAWNDLWGGAGLPQGMNPSGLVGGGGCPQARDLGPWAPSGTQGEDFEVTASDAPESNRGSAGVVLGLWWPHGNTPWGNREVTTFVQRGLSVTVVNGAGRGWDYESTCSEQEVRDQMYDHARDRQGDTDYYQVVAIEDLIARGLVTVRFDRSSGSSGINTGVNNGSSGVVNTPSTGVGGGPSGSSVNSGSTGGSCTATRNGNSDTMSTVSAPSGQTYVVEAWGGSLGDVFLIIPSGMAVSRTWSGGAIWAYNCSSTASVVSDVSGRGRSVYVFQNGQFVQQ